MSQQTQIHHSDADVEVSTTVLEESLEMTAKRKLFLDTCVESTAVTSSPYQSCTDATSAPDLSKSPADSTTGEMWIATMSNKHPERVDADSSTGCSSINLKIVRRWAMRDDMSSSEEDAHEYVPVKHSRTSGRTIKPVERRLEKAVVDASMKKRGRRVKRKKNREEARTCGEPEKDVDAFGPSPNISPKFRKEQVSSSMKREETNKSVNSQCLQNDTEGSAAILSEQTKLTLTTDTNQLSSESLHSPKKLECNTTVITSPTFSETPSNCKQLSSPAQKQLSQPAEISTSSSLLVGSYLESLSKNGVNDGTDVDNLEMYLNHMPSLQNCQQNVHKNQSSHCSLDSLNLNTGFLDFLNAPVHSAPNTMISSTSTSTSTAVPDFPLPPHLYVPFSLSPKIIHSSSTLSSPRQTLEPSSSAVTLQVPSSASCQMRNNLSSPFLSNEAVDRLAHQTLSEIQIPSLNIAKDYLSASSGNKTTIAATESVPSTVIVTLSMDTNLMQMPEALTINAPHQTSLSLQNLQSKQQQQQKQVQSSHQNDLNQFQGGREMSRQLVEEMLTNLSNTQENSSGVQPAPIHENHRVQTCQGPQLLQSPASFGSIHRASSSLLVSGDVRPPSAHSNNSIHLQALYGHSPSYNLKAQHNLSSVQGIFSGERVYNRPQTTSHVRGPSIPPFLSTSVQSSQSLPIPADEFRGSQPAHNPLSFPQPLGMPQPRFQNAHRISDVQIPHTVQTANNTNAQPWMNYPRLAAGTQKQHQLPLRSLLRPQQNQYQDYSLVLQRQTPQSIRMQCTQNSQNKVTNLSTSNPKPLLREKSDQQQEQPNGNQHMLQQNNQQPRQTQSHRLAVPSSQRFLSNAVDDQNDRIRRQRQPVLQPMGIETHQQDNNTSNRLEPFEKIHGNQGAQPHELGPLNDIERRLPSTQNKDESCQKIFQVIPKAHSNKFTKVHLSNIARPYTQSKSLIPPLHDIRRTNTLSRGAFQGVISTLKESNVSRVEQTSSENLVSQPKSQPPQISLAQIPWSNARLPTHPASQGLSSSSTSRFQNPQLVMSSLRPYLSNATQAFKSQEHPRTHSQFQSTYSRILSSTEAQSSVFNLRPPLPGQAKNQPRISLAHQSREGVSPGMCLPVKIGERPTVPSPAKRTRMETQGSSGMLSQTPVNNCSPFQISAQTSSVSRPSMSASVGGPSGKKFHRTSLLQALDLKHPSPLNLPSNSGRPVNTQPCVLTSQEVSANEKQQLGQKTRNTLLSSKSQEAVKRTASQAFSTHPIVNRVAMDYPLTNAQIKKEFASSDAQSFSSGQRITCTDLPLKRLREDNQLNTDKEQHNVKNLHESFGSNNRESTNQSLTLKSTQTKTLEAASCSRSGSTSAPDVPDHIRIKKEYHEASSNYVASVPRTSTNIVNVITGSSHCVTLSSSVSKSVLSSSLTTVPSHIRMKQECHRLQDNPTARLSTAVRLTTSSHITCKSAPGPSVIAPPLGSQQSKSSYDHQSSIKIKQEHYTQAVTEKPPTVLPVTSSTAALLTMISISNLTVFSPQKGSGTLQTFEGGTQSVTSGISRQVQIKQEQYMRNDSELQPTNLPPSSYSITSRTKPSYQSISTSLQKSVAALAIDGIAKQTLPSKVRIKQEQHARDTYGSESAESTVTTPSLPILMSAKVAEANQSVSLQENSGQLAQGDRKLVSDRPKLPHHVMIKQEQYAQCTSRAESAVPKAVSVSAPVSTVMAKSHVPATSLLQKRNEETVSARPALPHHVKIKQEQHARQSALEFTNVSTTVIASNQGESSTLIASNQGESSTLIASNQGESSTLIALNQGESSPLLKRDNQLQSQQTGLGTGRPKLPYHVRIKQEHHKTSQNELSPPNVDVNKPFLTSSQPGPCTEQSSLTFSVVKTFHKSMTSQTFSSSIVQTSKSSNTSSSAAPPHVQIKQEKHIAALEALSEKDACTTSTSTYPASRSVFSQTPVSSLLQTILRSPNFVSKNSQNVVKKTDVHKADKMQTRASSLVVDEVPLTSASTSSNLSVNLSSCATVTLPTNSAVAKPHFSTASSLPMHIRIKQEKILSQVSSTSSSSSSSSTSPVSPPAFDTSAPISVATSVAITKITEATVPTQKTCEVVYSTMTKQSTAKTLTTTSSSQISHLPLQVRIKMEKNYHLLSDDSEQSISPALNGENLITTLRGKNSQSFSNASRTAYTLGDKNHPEQFMSLPQESNEQAVDLSTSRKSVNELKSTASSTSISTSLHLNRNWTATTTTTATTTDTAAVSRSAGAQKICSALGSGCIEKFRARHDLPLHIRVKVEHIMNEEEDRAADEISTDEMEEMQDESLPWQVKTFSIGPSMPEAQASITDTSVANKTKSASAATSNSSFLPVFNMLGISQPSELSVTLAHETGKPTDQRAKLDDTPILPARETSTTQSSDMPLGLSQHAQLGANEALFSGGSLHVPCATETPSLATTVMISQASESGSTEDAEKSNVHMDGSAVSSKKQLSPNIPIQSVSKENSSGSSENIQSQDEQFTRTTVSHVLPIKMKQTQGSPVTPALTIHHTLPQVIQTRDSATENLLKQSSPAASARTELRDPTTRPVLTQDTWIRPLLVQNSAIRSALTPGTPVPLAATQGSPIKPILPQNVCGIPVSPRSTLSRALFSESIISLSETHPVHHNLLDSTPPSTRGVSLNESNTNRGQRSSPETQSAEQQRVLVTEGILLLQEQSVVESQSLIDSYIALQPGTVITVAGETMLDKDHLNTECAPHSETQPFVFEQIDNGGTFSTPRALTIEELQPALGCTCIDDQQLSLETLEIARGLGITIADSAASSAIVLDTTVHYESLDNVTKQNMARGDAHFDSSISISTLSTTSLADSALSRTAKDVNSSSFAATSLTAAGAPCAKQDISVTDILQVVTPDDALQTARTVEIDQNLINTDSNTTKNTISSVEVSQTIPDGASQKNTAELNYQVNVTQMAYDSPVKTDEDVSTSASVPTKVSSKVTNASSLGTGFYSTNTAAAALRDTSPRSAVIKCDLDTAASILTSTATTIPSNTGTGHPPTTQYQVVATSQASPIPAMAVKSEYQQPVSSAVTVVEGPQSSMFTSYCVVVAPPAENPQIKSDVDAPSIFPITSSVAPNYEVVVAPSSNLPENRPIKQDVDSLTSEPNVTPLSIGKSLSAQNIGKATCPAREYPTVACTIDLGLVKTDIDSPASNTASTAAVHSSVTENSRFQVVVSSAESFDLVGIKSVKTDIDSLSTSTATTSATVHTSEAETTLSQYQVVVSTSGNKSSDRLEMRSVKIDMDSASTDGPKGASATESASASQYQVVVSTATSFHLMGTGLVKTDFDSLTTNAATTSATIHTSVAETNPVPQNQVVVSTTSNESSALLGMKTAKTDIDSLANNSSINAASSTLCKLPTGPTAVSQYQVVVSMNDSSGGQGLKSVKTDIESLTINSVQIGNKAHTDISAGNSLDQSFKICPTVRGLSHVKTDVDSSTTGANRRAAESSAMETTQTPQFEVFVASVPELSDENIRDKQPIKADPNDAVSNSGTTMITPHVLLSGKANSGVTEDSPYNVITETVVSELAVPETDAVAVTSDVVKAEVTDQFMQAKERKFVMTNQDAPTFASQGSSFLQDNPFGLTPVTPGPTTSTKLVSASIIQPPKVFAPASIPLIPGASTVGAKTVIENSSSVLTVLSSVAVSRSECGALPSATATFPNTETSCSLLLGSGGQLHLETAWSALQQPGTAQGRPQNDLVLDEEPNFFILMNSPITSSSALEAPSNDYSDQAICEPMSSAPPTTMELPSTGYTVTVSLPGTDDQSEEQDQTMASIPAVCEVKKEIVLEVNLRRELIDLSHEEDSPFSAPATEDTNSAVNKASEEHQPCNEDNSASSSCKPLEECQEIIADLPVLLDNNMLAGQRAQVTGQPTGQLLVNEDVKQGEVGLSFPLRQREEIIDLRDDDDDDVIAAPNDSNHGSNQSPVSQLPIVPGPVDAQRGRSGRQTTTPVDQCPNSVHVSRSSGEQTASQIEKAIANVAIKYRDIVTDISDDEDSGDKEQIKDTTNGCVEILIVEDSEAKTNEIQSHATGIEGLSQHSDISEQQSSSTALPPAAAASNSSQAIPLAQITKQDVTTVIYPNSSTVIDLCDDEDDLNADGAMEVDKNLICVDSPKENSNAAADSVTSVKNASKVSASNTSVDVDVDSDDDVIVMADLSTGPSIFSPSKVESESLISNNLTINQTAIASSASDPQPLTLPQEQSSMAVSASGEDEETVSVASSECSLRSILVSSSQTNVDNEYCAHIHRTFWKETCYLRDCL